MLAAQYRPLPALAMSHANIHRPRRPDPLPGRSQHAPVQPRHAPGQSDALTPRGQSDVPARPRGAGQAAETRRARALAQPDAPAGALAHRSRRPDPRGPFVFDVRTLGSASARSQTRRLHAPANLGSGMVRIPAGSDLLLDLRFEEVSAGVLVTGQATATLAGECARCLEEFTTTTQVEFQELFVAEAGESDDDEYLLDGNLLDLEPALRDALVLDLPLSPLCAADCPGLCSTCGIRLADAEPGHGHAAEGGVWAALKDLFPPDMSGEGSGDAKAQQG